MKRLLLSFLLIFGSLVMSAQTLVTGATITKYEATSVETQPKLFVTPLAADLNIIQSASTTFKTKGVITLPEAPDTKNVEILERYAAEVRRQVSRNIEELKAQALFQFAEQSNADVIVAPSFSVETDSSKGRVVEVSIKVKGFPARYTNFRNLKPEDSILVRMSQQIPVGRQVRVLESSQANLETVEKN